jgi:hypothetical protein
MPRALTTDERYERLMEKKAALQESQQAPTPSSDGTATRRRRNTFNGTDLKLNVRNQIPGYHLHVFTDTGSRIQEALDGGWEFVKPDEVGGVSENVVSRNGDLGERIRYLVNPRSGEGSDKYGYLMKIRQEWYEEDQAELQKKNQRIDAAIRGGKITGDNPSFYVPRGGISVKS